MFVESARTGTNCCLCFFRRSGFFILGVPVKGETSRRKALTLLRRLVNSPPAETLYFLTFSSATCCFLSVYPIAGESESDECIAARKELETLLREIDVTERRIQKTNTAMDAEDIYAATIAVLASRVAKDEASFATLAGRKEVLQANVETACYKCSDLRKPEVLLELIGKNTPEANDIRLKLRTELKKRISRIDLVFYPDSSNIGMGITYVNNIRHLAVFSKEKNLVLLIEDSQGPEDSAQRVKEFLDKQADALS